MHIIATSVRPGPRSGRTARGSFAARAAVLLVVVAAAAGAAAEAPPEPAAAEGAEPTAAAQIAARRASVEERLAALDAAPAAEAAQRDEVRERLRAIGSLLREQADLAVSDTAAAEEPTDAEAAQPASVFALNALAERRFEREQLVEQVSDQLEASREALEAAKEQLQQAEAKRREAADGGAAGPAIQLRELASEAARERVNLRELQLRIAQRRAEGASGAASDEPSRVEEIRAAIAAGADDPSAGFADLADLEGRLRGQRDALARRLSTVELRLEAAQQSFARGGDSGAQHLARIEALTASRDALRQQIELVDAHIERIAAQRDVWRTWQSALRDADADDSGEAADALDARVDELESREAQRIGQRRDLERRVDELDARLARLPESAPLRDALTEQRLALSQLLDAVRADVGDVAADRRLTERALAELRGGTLDPFSLAMRALRALRDVWRYEITSVDDAPIRVGSLVLALLLAGVGLWASRRGSAWVGQYAAARLRLDAGAAAALQTLSFYALGVAFTLLALRAVHFPLTAFTVLGGALAIGIGFGSQNVMNNFISGLILMLERPVRAGDVVEVDSNHGTIESIGARSTQIRSVDGRHIVVPNSFFLENNVVNWTLSDDLIRTSVVVGVIYGSPTRLVADLIRQVVDEDDQVLKQVEPVLLFDEFGDNSLNFEVHFWVRARSPMAMRKVQSRIRFRIDDLFREHGLVIAFPQRDVHLDSVSPIEVRVLGGASQGSDPQGPVG